MTDSPGAKRAPSQISDGTRMFSWSNQDTDQGSPEMALYGSGVLDVPAGYQGGGVYNVMRYGATGDGATDDTTAWNACLAAATAASGTMVVPPGTYVITGWTVPAGYVHVVMAPGAVISGVNLPTNSDLGAGKHIVIDWWEPSSPKAIRRFVHRFVSGGTVPENEWCLEGYYHPAVVVDDLTGGTGTGADQCGYVFRHGGTTAWEIKSDASDDAIIILQAEDASRHETFTVDPTSDIGVGTDTQSRVSGNHEIHGLLVVRARGNNTTARAAVQMQAQAGTKSYLRLNGENRVLEFASDRNGGTTYWTAQPIAGSQVALQRRRSLTYSPSIDIDMSMGDWFVVAASDGVAFAINAPTNAKDFTSLTVTISNASGGALGTITWNGVFQMASWTNPANGFNRSITFRYDGAKWIEVSRTPADVPN